jgi:alcohol dehydrogenase class IV
VFSQVKPNPTGSNVSEGKAIYLKHGCDGVIAFGGGSGLDAGKAIALLVGQNRDLFEFEDKGDNWTKVNESAVAPCIAIPTTAGTGSEVGRASVIVDESDCVKKIIFHPSMLPELVIADPELTFGLPPKLTAATGVDAFVHSLEAYCAPGFHPMADGIAVEGMRLIWQWLSVAYKDPQHLEARSQMLVASSMGATAFQKGLGGIHALAHPLGAVYDAHHGLLNAILMPYVLKANRSAIESRLDHLGRCLGFAHTGFDYFLEELLRWRKSLDIPNTLADIGIDQKRSSEIAQMAHADPSAGGNPIQLSVQQYELILCDAIEGNL